MSLYVLIMHSVHWGINPPPLLKSIFFVKPLHKSANCPSCPCFLRQSPHIYWFFVTPLPLKIGFFSEPKFVVEISQLWQRKNVLFINFFCHEVFQSLVYFLCKSWPYVKVCPFESGKCQKEGKKLEKFEYLKNKTTFFEFLKGYHLVRK